MKPDKELEALLLEIYRIMPSSGSYPFTTMKLSAEDLLGVNLPPAAASSARLLVLKRSDFKEADLLDYVINTEEYKQMPPNSHGAFLDTFSRKSQDQAQMAAWCGKITSMGIGILEFLTRKQGIHLQPVDMDLTVLDKHFGFHTRHLQAYQLFDACFTG